MNYLLYGKEYFLLKRKLDEIIEELNIDNVISMDFETSKISEVLNEVCYIDLFNEKKLIILNNFSFKKLKEKDEKELINYLEQVNENVIIFRCIDETVDNRKAIVKKFNEKVTTYYFDKLKWNDLATYLYNYLIEEKYKVTLDIVKRVINLCGYNYYSTDNTFIWNEINKLMIYKIEDKEITKEDVDTIIVKDPDNELFDLVNAIINKDVNAIFNEFKKSKELNIDPYMIFNSICRQFRQQLQVKILSEEMNVENIASKLGLKSYPVELLIKTKNKYSYEELASIIDKLFYVDESMKSDTIDKYKVLEQLLSEFVE